MECGQLQTLQDVLASALVTGADGKVYFNVNILREDCAGLVPFIDCQNNHIPPENQLINAFGEDDCGLPVFNIVAPVEAEEPEADNQWNELPPFPIIAAKLGSAAPTLRTFMSDIEQYTFDESHDYVIGATEIIHNWDEGTDIYPHIHWATNGLEASIKGVHWELKYTIGDTEEAFGAQQTTAVDVAIPANTPDRTHIISEFDTPITGTGFRIGAYICWRLDRIVTKFVGGAPAAEPFAIAVGFHAEFNTLGSTTRTAK